MSRKGLITATLTFSSFKMVHLAAFILVHLYCSEVIKLLHSPIMKKCKNRLQSSVIFIDLDQFVFLIKVESDV